MSAGSAAVDLGLSGRVAVVGGSSRGIGFAAAGALAHAGCSVVLVGRGGEDLEAARKQLIAEHVREPHTVTADLSRAGDVERLVATVTEDVGPVDVLVNNSGGPPAGNFDVLTDEQWAAAFDGTFMSTVRLYRAVLDGMVGRGWGRIVNISSTSILDPIDGLDLSNAVRLAVHGLARSLAPRVAARGVTINTVCPGFTRTERLEQIMLATAEREGVPPEEIEARFAARNAVGRLIRPEEVGQVVAYLAADGAQAVSGATVAVDGGPPSSRF